MRDAVGATYIFAIVMFFTLLFSGFLVMALVYSKAYKLKNEVTTIIEKYEGLTYNDNKPDVISLHNRGSINIISNYLKNSGYVAKGVCNVEDNTGRVKYYGINIDDPSLHEINDSGSNQKYNYCVKVKQSKNKRRNDENICTTVFRVTIFFDFNLPFIGQLKKFSVSGQTNELLYAFIGNDMLDYNCS